MKMICLFALTGMFVLLTSFSVNAQGRGTDSLYINYNEYIRGLGDFVTTSPRVLWASSIGNLQNSASALIEEKAPAERIRTESGKSEIMSDEAIYAFKKQGVFMIGRFSSGSKPGDMQFDFKGTAFAISEEGTCVTNFHVLQEFMASKGKNRDLVYFIVGADRKVYIMDKLLAYSQNNDLAVFRVNTQGDKLHPIAIGKPAEVGATVFCISNPAAQLFYFTKGMVARNIIPDSTNILNYSRNGRTPIRMEITAEYGAGSSGGPVLDKYGNLVGIIATTYTIYLPQQDKDGNPTGQPQMVVRGTVPVKALTELINGN